MSEDVVLDALHRLEAAGLIMRRQKGRVVQWAVGDAGYTLMGKPVPCESAAMGREVAREVPSAPEMQQRKRWRGLAHIYSELHPARRAKRLPSGRYKRQRRLRE